jgi:hypothetical protein
MIKRSLILSGVALLALASLSCNQRTDKDEGGVILSIVGFDGLPFRVLVNSQDVVQIEELTLENIPKDPNGLTSDLMDIELRSFEVTFTRADVGTRLPPARVAGIFGNVPVGGEDTINNLDVMGLDQLRNPPLSDLLFENGSFDRETGSQAIQLNVNLRFFGRTLAGDNIASNIASFMVEFVP